MPTAHNEQTGLCVLVSPLAGEICLAHGQKTKGFCREALKVQVPISSCHHPFGTHGIRPLSACQGCPRSSTLRDGAGAGHTHSTPSLPPASAENGVSHSPLGFQHSLKAWSTAPDQEPRASSRRKQARASPTGWGPFQPASPPYDASTQKNHSGKGRVGRTAGHTVEEAK